jgi:hypothetical protein
MLAPPEPHAKCLEDGVVEDVAGREWRTVLVDVAAEVETLGRNPGARQCMNRQKHICNVPVEE